MTFVSIVTKLGKIIVITTDNEKMPLKDKIAVGGKIFKVLTETTLKSVSKLPMKK